MRVKTRITFEVEYPLNMDFYSADKKKALEMEREYVIASPLEIIRAFDAMGGGIFDTKVERVEQDATENVTN